MSLYSKKNTGLSIFQDVSVCVAGDLSAARALSNEVKRLGGTVHFSVSDKTTMLVLVKGQFAQKEYKTKLALRKNVPIVSERYVKDCAAQQRRLGLKGYMLTEEERIPEHIMERCKQLEERSVFVSLDSLSESGEVKEEMTKSVDPSDGERNPEESSEHSGERSDVQGGGIRGAPKKRGTVAWRSAKIFISSTFKDMHGERDYITRFVLPELQERARALRVNVHMIDLRWGVTGEEQPLQTCLAAVDEARPFFVGLVGERYGWVPERYDVPPLPQYNWLRSYPLGHSITHLEMYYGAMRDPSSAEASFYIRDPSFIGSVPSSLERDFVDTTDVARKGLAKLKEQIRASGIPLVDHYGCNWRGMVDGKPMVGGLEAFGEAVLENLWAGIVNRFGGASVETDEHESFASAQSSGFVGRSRLLQKMNAYVSSDAISPLLVNGEPGSGKSSLVAAFTAKMLKGNDAHTICHFVGAAPGSTDLRFMLVRLCTLLQPHYEEGLFPPRVPEGLQEVQQLFLSAMATPPKSKVVVVIDAVNQLDPTHNAHGVEWMPSELPSNGVRLVVSVLPGPVLTRLELKCSERLRVGPLEEEDRKEMVRTILQKHSKKLAEEPGNDQLGLLLRKKDAYKPLYLVIACEELRVFGVYEQLSMRIRQMAGTVQELLREVLERLEGDHGEELVRHALAMIACSRGGLKEDELRQVLVDNVLHMSEDEGTKAWQYLLRSLNVFLTRTGRHGDVCTFFHEQLLIAVRAVYFCSDLRSSSDVSGRITLRESDGWGEAHEMSSFESAVHKMMADYFHNVLFHLESEDAMLAMLRERPVNLGADLEKEIVSRAVAHVVYHGTLGGAWQSVYKYLTSLPFIECKCLIGLTYDLVSDYLRITRPGVVELFRAKYCFDREEANSAVESLEEFHSFVQFSAHTLQRRPDLAFSLARSAPSKSGPAQAAADRWNSLLERRTHLSWLNKPDSARPCLLTMVGHDKIVRSCDTFPTSERDIIVSGGEDSCARVWDTRTGEQAAVLKGHSATVMAVAFAPCGTFVATGSWDRTLVLWDTTTWQQVDSFSHRAPITAVTFSGDSSEIIIGDNNGGIRVLSRMGLRSIHSEAPHSNKVERVEYHPLSRDRCATAGGNVVKLWKASSHGLSLERELSHRRAVRSLAYMPKGGLLAVASERKVLMWDLESTADTPTVTLTGHNDDIATISWSRNGEYFISGSHDNVIFIWETTNWNRLGYFSGHTGTVLGVRFAHNPDRIVSCSYDRSVKLWDRRRVMRKTGSHTARILGVAFSHSAQRVVTGSRDKMVKVWDVATGSVVMTLAGHRSNVLDVDISQDGTMIASCSRDRTAIIWDAGNGSILHTLEGHTELVAGCKFSPDGRILVTGSDDKTARIWDTSNGSCIGVLYGHRDAVTCVAVSYDGKRIATGSRDSTLKLWDARTRSKVATLSRHTGQVMCCAFSRDNERILTGGDDWKLVESSARNAKQLHVWTNHSAAVRGCSYSANGKLLVSVSTDGTAVVYRTDTKEEVCSYACQSRATAVSFSHIGSRLAVGDGSGQMYLLEPVHAASEALE